MNDFKAIPLENGKFKIVVDGVELEGEYTQDEIGEVYAEVWH